MIASFKADAAEFAGNIVGRILRPDFLDGFDRLDEFARAHGAIGVVEQLEVGEQPARADAEHEAAAGHVIELCCFGRDHHRIVVRQADHRGAEAQILGARREARHEHQRRGDRLGGGGKMLADPEFVEAELIGVERLLFVFGERVGERAGRRVHRHHEHSEPHSLILRLPASVGLPS